MEYKSPNTGIVMYTDLISKFLIFEWPIQYCNIVNGNYYSQ